MRHPAIKIIHLVTNSKLEIFRFFFSPPRNSLPQASKNDDFRAGALPQPCAARFGRSHMNCSTGGLKTWDSHKGGIRTIPFHQGGCSFKVNQTKLNQTTIATSSCFIEIWEWFGSSQGNCNSSRTYSAWPDVNVNKKASAMNYLWQFSFFPTKWETSSLWKKYISLKSHPFPLLKCFRNHLAAVKLPYRSRTTPFTLPRIGDWILGQPNKSSQIRPHEPRQNWDSLVIGETKSRISHHQKV